MKVYPIFPESDFYASTNYLVLGEWNRLHNVNTLIDAGGAEEIIDKIQSYSTGFGKQPIEQVILTHSHFDHTSALRFLATKYHPKVFSFAATPHTTNRLKNGETIAVADENFEVLHAPFHSQDSVCLFCRKHGILFSGDVPLQIRTPGGSYPEKFVAFLEMLIHLPLKMICPGHGAPLESGLAGILATTLENVKKSTLFCDDMI